MNEIAIHEAGHAIMFDALDVPIELVSIDPGCCEQENPSLEGCVKLKNESNAVLDVLVATLAGPGASFFIAGVFPDVVAFTKYKSDQRILWQIHQGQNVPAPTMTTGFVYSNSWLAGYVLGYSKIKIRSYASRKIYRPS